MKLLLEALVAGSILLGSCAGAQRQQTEIRALEERIDDYQRGIILKNTAEAETDQAQKIELYNSAGNHFYTAMLKRNKTYEAMIEYAYCLSQIGDFKQALEWIDKAITLQESDTAYDTKGLICARKGLATLAEDSFTNAIMKKDIPQYRWHRFQARLRIGLTQKNSHLDKALEDIQKITEQRPDEPDGHIFTASVYGLMLMTRRESAHQQDVYSSLKKAFELIDAGKKSNFNMFELNEFRSAYNELKKQYEPIKTTFEEENY